MDRCPRQIELLIATFASADTWAGVFFGNTRKWDVRDAGLRDIYRAFNDFALELNATAPDRILILPELAAMH